MTKKILVSLAIAVTLSASSRVLAQSPTATDSPTIRDSVKQQVDAELSQIKNAVAKRGFVGSVTAKTDGNISLTTLASQTRTCTLAADTVFKLVSGKDGTSADLKVGDNVIAMGDVDSQNKMTVKRLIVVPSPSPDKRKVVYATVKTVTASSTTVEVDKKDTFTLKISATTKFTGKTKATDLKVGSQLVLIGSSDTTSFTPLLIHLFTSAN